MKQNVEITMRDKITDELVDSWWIYKMKRIKNKVLAYSHFKNLKFTFKTIKGAKKLIQHFKDAR